MRTRACRSSGRRRTTRRRPGWLWTGREHVFRSTNYGRNPVMTKAQHQRALQPLDGRLRRRRGRRLRRQRHLRRLEAARQPGCGRPADERRLRRRRGPAARSRPSSARTATGRRSGRRRAPVASSSRRTRTPRTRQRSSSTGSTTTDGERRRRATRRRSTWIRRTRTTPGSPTAASTRRRRARPGHVFEVAVRAGRLDASRSSTGRATDAFGDIPATSIAVANDGTIFVGTDYGAVTSSGDGSWAEAGKGLPARRRLRPRLRALA